MVGELSPAPFNYEARQEAWKSPAALQREGSEEASGGHCGGSKTLPSEVRDGGRRESEARVLPLAKGQGRVDRSWPVRRGASGAQEPSPRSSQQAFLEMTALM